jgi:hypothetical protein
MQHDGHNWLLTLLSTLSKEAVGKTLLLFWRSWYMRNDVIHGSSKATVKGSVNFLTSYISALSFADHAVSGKPSTKGKKIINEGFKT